MSESSSSEQDSARNETATGGTAREGFSPVSVAQFLIALVLLLVTAPFMDQLAYGDLVEAVLMTLVLLSAVMAVGGRRTTLIAGAVLVTPALVGRWIDHVWPDLLPREVTLTAAIVFVAFVIVHLFRFILRSPKVDSEVLCAACAAYLMMGMLWAFAFALVERWDPDSFVFTVGSDHSMAGFQGLYFSLGTLTTVDYGDIIPLSNVARMLAISEATIGVFYVAILIARLVSLYSSKQSSEVRANDPDRRL